MHDLVEANYDYVVEASRHCPSLPEEVQHIVQVRPSGCDDEEAKLVSRVPRSLPLSLSDRRSPLLTSHQQNRVAALVHPLRKLVDEGVVSGPVLLQERGDRLSQIHWLRPRAERRPRLR